MLKTQNCDTLPTNPDLKLWRETLKLQKSPCSTKPLQLKTLAAQTPCGTNPLQHKPLAAQNPCSISALTASPCNVGAWAACVHGWLSMHHFGTVFLGFTDTPSLTAEARFFSDGLGDFSSCGVASALGGKCLYCLFLCLLW